VDVQHTLESGLLALRTNYLQFPILVLDAGNLLVEVLRILVIHPDEILAMEKEFLQQHLTLCALLFEHDVFVAAVGFDRLDSVYHSFNLLAFQVQAIQVFGLLAYLN